MDSGHKDELFSPYLAHWRTVYKLGSITRRFSGQEPSLEEGRPDTKERWKSSLYTNHSIALCARHAFLRKDCVTSLQIVCVRDVDSSLLTNSHSIHWF